MAFLDYAPRRLKPAHHLSKPSFYVRRGKRLFDLVLCTILLPVVFPIIAALWCIATVIGPSGFFAHLRIGRNGRVFRCWKIRTMGANADHSLNSILRIRVEQKAEWAKYRKLENDPRVLPFGRTLRWTGLDELPQIWNVIRGDMSLVGPRPVTRVEMRYYGADAAYYLNARPGITGLWQVTGRQSGCYVQRVDLDKRYVKGITFLGDVHILAKTFSVLVRPTGR